jgi:hypothetical protein
MRLPRTSFAVVLTLLGAHAAAQVTPVAGSGSTKSTASRTAAIAPSPTPGPGTAASVLPPSFDSIRPVPVFWVFGQSNAEGGASGFWLRIPPPSGPGLQTLANQSNVRIWWPGNSALRPGSPAAWEGYVTGEVLVPVNNANYHISEGAFGTEASLGYALHKRLGQAVWIFKYTAVAPLNPAGARSWSKSAGPGGLYDSMMADWRSAADALRAQGLTPDIRGLFWLQGEGDRGPNNAWAREYANHLRQFIADLRTDLAGDTGANDGPVRAPFVISALHPHHDPARFWDEAESILRAAQREVAGDDPLNVYVETEELSLDKSSPGWVHFDGRGLVELGYSFAEAWWKSARDR